MQSLPVLKTIKFDDNTIAPTGGNAGDEITVTNNTTTGLTWDAQTVANTAITAKDAEGNALTIKTCSGGQINRFEIEVTAIITA